MWQLIIACQPTDQIIQSLYVVNESFLKAYAHGSTGMYSQFYVKASKRRYMDTYMKYE